MNRRTVANLAILVVTVAAFVAVQLSGDADAVTVLARWDPIAHGEAKVMESRESMAVLALIGAPDAGAAVLVNGRSLHRFERGTVELRLRFGDTVDWLPGRDGGNIVRIVDCDPGLPTVHPGWERAVGPLPARLFVTGLR